MTRDLPHRLGAHLAVDPCPHGRDPDRAVELRPVRVPPHPRLLIYEQLCHDWPITRR